MSAHNLPISDSILLDQAKEFLPKLAISSIGFKCSNGWLQNWKKRYCLTARKMNGESSSVNMSDVKLARDELKKNCSQFLVEDRYNFDETAKFF